MLYLIVFHPILFNDNNCKIPSFSRYTGSDINLLQDPFCIFRSIIFTRDYVCQFFMGKEIAAHFNTMAISHHSFKFPPGYTCFSRLQILLAEICIYYLTNYNQKGTENAAKIFILLQPGQVLHCVKIKSSHCFFGDLLVEQCNRLRI